MRIVIAIGGNMISDASKKDEVFEEQQKRIEETARLITKIHKQGHYIIVTHGNGPQVGSLLLQQQADVSGSTNLPLKILGPLTQGQIGVSLQHALVNEFRKNDLSSLPYVVPTSVIVDGSDTAFSKPTKPIGPFYSEKDYEQIETDGMTFTKTPKGYRRVVPSPIPKHILEADLIRQLYDDDCLVIAVGGGGTPTIDQDNQITMTDAVIDKDRASALLAKEVNADMLIILTNVDGVYQNFGEKDEKILNKLRLEEAEELLQSLKLGEGSMKPKVEAAVDFVKFGKRVIITSPEKVLDAIDGKAGTHFFAAEQSILVKNKKE